MPRKLSSIAADWWDYTTLDDEIIRAAASLTPELMPKLSRSGFKVVLYDTLEDFYLAEALEYINAWRGGSWRASLPSWPLRLTVTTTARRASALRLVTEELLRSQGDAAYGRWNGRGGTSPRRRERATQRARARCAAPSSGLRA